MELVRGSTLRAVLDDNGALDARRAVDIAVQVADALEAAHRQGLVHRDVKPGNILLSDDGRVLVADFGIAKAAEAAGDLTEVGQVVGTAKYLSPEQVEGGRGRRPLRRLRPRRRALRDALRPAPVHRRDVDRDRPRPPDHHPSAAPPDPRRHPAGPGGGGPEGDGPLPRRPPHRRRVPGGPVGRRAGPGRRRHHLLHVRSGRRRPHPGLRPSRLGDDDRTPVPARHSPPARAAAVGRHGAAAAGPAPSPSSSSSSLSSASWPGSWPAPISVAGSSTGPATATRPIRPPAPRSPPAAGHHRGPGLRPPAGRRRREQRAAAQAHRRRPRHGLDHRGLLLPRLRQPEGRRGRRPPAGRPRSRAGALARWRRPTRGGPPPSTWPTTSPPISAGFGEPVATASDISGSTTFDLGEARGQRGPALAHRPRRPRAAAATGPTSSRWGTSLSPPEPGGRCTRVEPRRRRRRYAPPIASASDPTWSSEPSAATGRPSRRCWSATTTASTGCAAACAATRPTAPTPPRRRSSPSSGASTATTAEPPSRPGPTGWPPTPPSTRSAAATAARARGSTCEGRPEHGRQHRVRWPTASTSTPPWPASPPSSGPPSSCVTSAPWTTPRSPRCSTSRRARSAPASPGAGPSWPTCWPREPGRGRRTSYPTAMTDTSALPPIPTTSGSRPCSTARASPATTPTSTSCAACSARLAQLRAVSVAVAAPARPLDPARRATAVAAALAEADRWDDEAAGRAHHPRRPAAGRLPGWLAAAAVLLLVALAVPLARPADRRSGRDDDVGHELGAVGGGLGRLRRRRRRRPGSGRRGTPATSARSTPSPTCRPCSGSGPPPADAAGEAATTTTAAAGGGAEGAPATEGSAVSCEAVLRAGDPQLGSLLVSAEARFDGEAVAVLGFEAGGQARVYAVAVGTCEIRTVQTAR